MSEIKAIKGSVMSGGSGATGISGFTSRLTLRFLGSAVAFALLGIGVVGASMSVLVLLGLRRFSHDWETLMTNSRIEGAAVLNRAVARDCMLFRGQWAEVWRRPALPVGRPKWGRSGRW